MRGIPMNEHTDHDHLLTTGGGALTGGALGAAAGALIGGPIGVALGGVVGTAVGAVAGDRIGEELDHRSDLVHFASVYTRMPYYVLEMEWPDYEPAYRYAVEVYDTYRGRTVDEVEATLQDGWAYRSDRSHLTWAQAKPVFEHVWQAHAQSDADHHSRKARAPMEVD